MKYIYILIIGSTLMLCTTMSFSQDFSLSKSDTSFYQVVEKAENYIAKMKKNPDKEANSILNEKHYYRWKYFWETRVDRNGGFKTYANQMQKLAKQNSSNSQFKSASSTSSVQWTPLGPTSKPTQVGAYKDNNGVCQVASVWSDGTDIYAGLNGGGLWKRDSSSWTNLTDDIMAFSVNDIAIDNTGKIYIATGFVGQGSSMMTGDLFGYGVMYSIDDGVTWETDKMSPGPDEDFFIMKVIIHPSQQNVVWALSRKHVYKSIDGGDNWNTTITPSLTNNQFFRDLVFKESNPDIMFLCTDGWDHSVNKVSSGCIYKSTDAGDLWDSSTNLADNLLYASDYPHWLEFATTPDNPSALYIVYRDTILQRTTLEKSKNDGADWVTLVDHGYAGSREHMMYELEISPTDSTDIYVGGVYQYRYDSSPLPKFTEIGSTLHSDLRDFHIVSSGGTTRIYQGNDGGIYSSADRGDTWTDLTNGLQGALFYGIAISETSPNTYLGGVGDCGTHFNNGTSWYHMSIDGDGGTCLINHTNNDNMIAMLNGSPRYTIDGGDNWGITGEDIQGYNKPLIQHPTLNKIYVASIWAWRFTIRYSTDYGANWTSLMPGWQTGSIYAMDISESNPSTMYISRLFNNPSTTTVQKTTNEGSSWIDITSNIGSIVNEAHVTNIEVHPTDPDNVWISFGGVSDGNKVFHTIDGGLTWSNISYNLENVPVMDILYDYANHQIYIATDIGPYYMDYDGTSWSKMGEFPQTITTNLALSKTTGKLFASTWGRGLWETEIPGHCFDGSTTSIWAHTTYSEDIELCENLKIYAGSLTVEATLIMPFDATITVTSGTTLTVDGGAILNANIIVESGGTLALENGGIIELIEDDELNANSGALLQIDQGVVRTSLE